MTIDNKGLALNWNLGEDANTQLRESEKSTWETMEADNLLKSERKAVTKAETWIWMTLMIMGRKKIQILKQGIRGYIQQDKLSLMQKPSGQHWY